MCALVRCHCTKVQTQCAKLVDEQNNRLFSCLSVRDLEPKILIKSVHLTTFEERKQFFLMKKGIHIVNLKKHKKGICHRTTFFYSIFNIKPEIHIDLPKIRKIK